MNVGLKLLFSTWATALCCDNFKYVHDRESHEVLLAILNKKKKLSFDADFDPKHQNYEVQLNNQSMVTKNIT